MAYTKESHGIRCKCGAMVVFDNNRLETLTEIAQNLHGTYTGSAELYFGEEGKRDFEADKAELKKRLDEWIEPSSKNEYMNAVDYCAKAYFQAIYNEVENLQI